MNTSISIDYREWVIKFLFSKVSFLMGCEEEIGQVLPIIFEKRDFEAVKKLFETATKSPGLREKFFLMIQEISQEELNADEKLFLHKLIVQKVLTKEESLVVARTKPYSKLLFSGALELELNNEERDEMIGLNKPFMKKMPLIVKRD